MMSATRFFTKECQSFLDNLVAQFGRGRSQNDQPRGVGNCARADKPQLIALLHDVDALSAMATPVS
jgi:hypothetical protein